MVFCSTPTKTARQNFSVIWTTTRFLRLGCWIFTKRCSIRSYLDRAIQLTDIMLREFWDERDGGFYFTGKSHEQLISRAKPIFDASIPSGNAMATQFLLRLYHLTGNDQLPRPRRESVAIVLRRNGKPAFWLRPHALRLGFLSSKEPKKS